MVTAPQVSVKLVAWLVAPLAGVESVGAPGAATTVVKFQTLDHTLVPFAFVAFARQ